MYASCAAARSHSAWLTVLISTGRSWRCRLRVREELHTRTVDARLDQFAHLRTRTPQRIHKYRSAAHDQGHLGAVGPDGLGLLCLGLPVLLALAGLLQSVVRDGVFAVPHQHHGTRRVDDLGVVLCAHAFCAGGGACPRPRAWPVRCQRWSWARHLHPAWRRYRPVSQRQMPGRPAPASVRRRCCQRSSRVCRHARPPHIAVAAGDIRIRSTGQGRSPTRYTSSRGSSSHSFEGGADSHEQAASRFAFALRLGALCRAARYSGNPTGGATLASPLPSNDFCPHRAHAPRAQLLRQNSRILKATASHMKAAFSDITHPLTNSEALCLKSL